MPKIYQIRQYLLIVFWFFYLILFPFQFFPPSSLQIADFSIILGIVILIFTGWSIDIYIKNFSYFVLYTLLIGFGYYFLYEDFDFIKQPLNYTYCLLSLIFISQVAKQSVFIITSVLGVFFSLVIQLFVLNNLGLNQEQFRITLFFNNPNQLGLWALSFLIFIAFLIIDKNELKYKKIILLPSLFLCLFYIFLSISQAAIISSALVLIILLIYFFRSKWIYISFISLSVIFFQFEKDLKIENFNFLVNVQDRIEREINEDDGDNDLDGRNYTRLGNYPQFLLLGAGEGKIERFGNNGLEIHSTFANILFSYGFFGLILFILPFINFIKLRPLIYTLLLGSYLFFTLVHNTLRWPLFWIIPYLMYLILSINHKNIKT